MAPPNRLAALHDALPPSSPEFSIRKPYQDQHASDAKRRRSSRVVKTYSDRPHRRPILPPSLQRLRGLEIPTAQPDENLFSPSSSSVGSDPMSSDPIETTAFLSSPPSSPPARGTEVEVKLRRSPRFRRVPLAPVFLFNGTAVKRETKREAKDEGTKDQICERALRFDGRPKVKTEVLVKPEPVPWKIERQEMPDVKKPIKTGTEGIKPELVGWKMELEATPLIKDEDTKIKSEVKVKKEWPIFSFAARARQTRPVVAERMVEQTGIKPEVDKNPETPIKQEKRIKRERADWRHPTGSSPPFAGLLGISPRDDNIKSEITVKAEPPLLGPDGHIKTEKLEPMSDDTIKEEPFSNQSLSCQTRIKGETFVKTDALVEAEHPVKVEPIKEESAPLPLPSSPLSTNEEECQPDQAGFYSHPYSYYVNASRRQAVTFATTNPTRKPPSGPKIQTTLNLSTKLPFKECKLCDTVYNPLHPADVKLHQAMHERALRSSGLALGGKKRKRELE
jgi:hypothetical protein